MAKYAIYRQDGTPVYQNGFSGQEAFQVFTDSLEYVGTDMGERFLTVTVKAPYPISFAVGDYITYRNEKFALFGDGGVVKCSSSGTYGEGFVYDGLKFCWSGQELVENEFLDLVLLDNQVHYTCMPEFSFFCENVDDLLDRLQANMDALQFPVKYLTFASDEALDDNFDYRFVYNAERAFLYTAKTGNSVTALIFRTSEWILKYTLSNGVFVRSGSAPVVYSVANWNTATSGYSSVTLYRLNGRWKFYSPNKERSIQRGVTEEEWNAYYPIPQGETYQSPVYEITRKNITISSQNCWGALTLVNSDFKLNFFVQDKDVVVGAERAALSQSFIYGKDNGLYQIGRNIGDDAAVITRLHGYGTDENIGSRYYNYKSMLPYCRVIEYFDIGTDIERLFNIVALGVDISHERFSVANFYYYATVSDFKNAFTSWEELDNATTRSAQKIYPWVGMKNSYIARIKVCKSYDDYVAGNVYDAVAVFHIIAHSTDIVYTGIMGEDGEVTYYDQAGSAGSPSGERYYTLPQYQKYGRQVNCCAILIDKDVFDEHLNIARGSNVYIAFGANKEHWDLHQDNQTVYRGFEMRTENNNMAIQNLMLPGFPLQSLDSWVRSHLDTSRGDSENADGSITWNGYTAFFSKELDNPYIDSLNKDSIGLRPYSTIFDGNDNKKDVHPTIEEITIGDLLDAGLLVSNPYYQQNRTTRVDKIFEAGEPITDTGIVDADGYTNDEVTNEKIKAKETFELTLYSLGFDLKKYIEASGANATISFTDGMLSGREFEIFKAEEINKSVVVHSEPSDYNISISCWKVTCKRKTDDTLGIYFPKYGYNVSANDKFVLLGINLPDAYVDVASVKLLKESLKYLKENEHTKYLYEPKIDEIFMARQHQSAIANETPSLYNTIKEGQLFSFNDTDLGLEITMPINTLNIKENGNNGIPTFEITLKDDIEATQVTRSGQASSAGESVNIDGGMTYPQVKALIEDWVTPRFLSKFGDDTANGVIGFVKGLWVKAKGLFGISEDGDARVKSINVNEDYGIEEDGDARVNDFEAIGSAIIGGNVTIDGILQAFAKVLTNKIESENWTGDGAFDTGFRLQKGTDGVTSMVVDNLFVRMKAIFTELEIRKISYAGGNIIFSHAGSKVVKVKPIYSEYYLYIPDGTYDEKHEGINLDNGIYLPADEGLDLQTAYLIPTNSAVVTAYRCYILKDDGTTATENWWRVDDQARCQTFNVVEPGNYSHAENTYYWRRVIEVGMEVLEDGKTYDYVDLSATDCASYSDIPKEGDQLVQMGNRTDSTRQGFISIEVSGEDAPSFKVYKGVSGYTLENKRKICLSPSLTDLHVQKLTIETDYGVSSRVPIERGDWSGITDHKCYYYDIVQHNGSTWLCIVSEGSYTTDEPSANSAYWRIYAQKGKDGEDGKSFSIKGSYDTYAELIAAHPTGEVGDAYIVGNDLYIWDAEREEWHNNGQFKGEDGNNYVSVYTPALSQPAAPSGTSVPPTGWFTDIPQITNVSAAGDFSEDNGWRKASGNHIANAFIKDTLTFTTTQPNQKVFIQIRPSSEGAYDIIAVGLLDTDLANRAAVTALDASRKTSGTEPKTVETTVATAGQHTLCIVYSKDANTDRREDSAWYRLAPVDVYISTAAFKGTVMQGAWSTPVRYSANGEDSISVVLSPSTLLVNQDMENTDNLSNLSEDVFVSVYKGAVPQVITTITLTGTTHCNATVYSNYVRLTAVHTDANNKYYDNGNITFNVTYRDSDTQEIKSVANLVIRFNANLLGTWSESVIGETKQEIGRSTWFDVDPTTGNIVESQRLGNFIRSSQENTSRLEESNYFNIFTGNNPSFPISFSLSSSQITKYGSSYRLSLNVASDEGDLTIKVLKGSTELFVYQNVNDVLEEVMTGLTEGTYTITCNKTATVVSVGIYSTAANTDKYSQIKQTVDSIDLTVKGILPSKNLFSGVLSAKGWKSATSSIVGSGIPVTVNNAVLGSDGFINAKSGDSYIIGSAYISSYTPYTLSFYSKNTARLKITVFPASYPSMAQSWYVDAVSSVNTRRTLSFQIGFSGDLYISIESTSIIYPQIEKGTEATDFVASDTEISSAINMTADNIHAAVVSELGETGIDISGTNRNITLQADKVKFTNSAGTVDNKIWIDTNTGTLHTDSMEAENATVRGTIYANNGEFGGQLKGVNGTFTQLKAADDKVEITTTPGAWGGYNWYGFAATTDGTYDTDLATIGARITNTYDYGRLVLVKRNKQGTQQQIIILDAGDGTITAPIMKPATLAPTGFVAVVHENDGPYSLPANPLNGQMIYLHGATANAQVYANGHAIGNGAGGGNVVGPTGTWTIGLHNAMLVYTSVYDKWLSLYSA